MFRLSILIVISAVIIGGCVERIEHQPQVQFSEYFPINVDDYRVYDKLFGKAVITRMIGDLATVTHYDTAGNIINWVDLIVKSGGTYQKNFVNRGGMNIHFEPAMPFSPWTDIVGDTLHQTVVEIRNDSLNTHLRIRLEYAIVSRDTIIVPAGKFEDCIKMELLYTTLDQTDQFTFDGISYIWYARGVGIIRYTANGQTAELIEASIDGEMYPGQEE